MAPTPQQLERQLQSSKPPKVRVQRYLKRTVEGQLRETNAKNVLLLRGISCCHKLQLVLQDLRRLASPGCKLLSKKNLIAPFETAGQQSLEFLTTKNDCSLFVLASHNKKRPNNLVLGRTFDRGVLDMAELGVLRFKSIADHGSSATARIGSKPMLLFVGSVWEESMDYCNLQNLLTDVYRGDVVDKLVLEGLDHLIVFTASTNPGGNRGDASAVTIHQRTYFCKVQNASSSSSPQPSLTPCGPDLDYTLRRTQWADADLYKAARKQPAAIKSKKKKNNTTNLFGETIGRLHLDKQNIDKMQGRRSKALRRAEKIAADEEREALDRELHQEKEHMDKELEQTLTTKNME